MAEEVTPPTTPETPPVEQAKETPPPSKLVERVTKLGFENVASDDEAFDRLASAFEQQREQFSAQLKAITEELRSSQPTPSPEQAQKKEWYSPPPADLNLAAKFRTPEGGWKPETPPEIRNSVEAREAYKAAFAQKLLEDPEQTLEPLLAKKFGEYFDSKFGQVSAEQQTRQFFERELATHGAWIYEKDPISGSPTNRFTAEGQRFNEVMAELEGDGMSKVKAFQVALRLRAAEKAASASSRPTLEQAQQINAEKKAGLIGQPAGNRSGSLPGKTNVPNKNLTFGQKVVQHLQAGA